ncbi:MAG: NAD(P)-binding protein [Methylotenera sp.]|uniref:NAD(P)-binding protein n=1 Tax=Methylotenera sp. TaxID=2051956 RepID=UPI00248954B5|nr:NAD(P)-binding protein [Methylotenera sp.]MDI1310345.1 NAD(P)-binding protein [Methylotenera sp.]
MSLTEHNNIANSKVDAQSANTFASFWMAGYEGADHINGAGISLAMNEANRHASRAYDDYLLLSELGIRTVRESIGWRLVEKNGHFDFSSILLRAKAAKELGIQINWTFCHYGWPLDIDVYSPQFIERFAQYCRHAVTFLSDYIGEIPIYSPINEISFASWAAAANKFACIHAENDGGARLKRQLVRATIRGCDEIWKLQPKARILQCDPLIRVGAPQGWPVMEGTATSYNLSQYEAWDMICGKLEPELGGAPQYLDIVGINYYHNNQWGVEAQFPWHLGDTRRIPFHQMLMEVYQRYQRPLIIAETSHVGSGRGAWIREIAQETILAKQHGVNIDGICLYPALDRPDWENEHHWHHSGVWDIEPSSKDLSSDAESESSDLTRSDLATSDFKRIPCAPYIQAIHNAQRLTKHFSNLLVNQAMSIPMYTGASSSKGNKMSTIFVFSHLRWNFVFQRPQHLLSRLAEHYQVIFIEEPVFDNRDCFFSTSTPVPNVTVCTPHVPVQAHGFHDDYLPYMKTLIAELVEDFEDYVVWFYTPMALPLLQGMNPSVVIYDCMDELSAFANPPKQLLQRENALLGIADIVFTGGPSLYNAKKERHNNVHCFPSSVDVIHFQQALDRNNGHPAQHAISGPKLGFYGVIDERFDADLIAYVAKAHPEWQIVLVGPIVKINPSILPRQANIHYIDQQPYQALPQFLAGWDVCLLPFALNESTRFISPTKTLEYMAAELPIVSTPIKDVIDLYGSAVAIAETHQDFVLACEKLLAETEYAKQQRIENMRGIVAQTSWESAALSMHEMLQKLICPDEIYPDEPLIADNQTAQINTRQYNDVVTSQGLPESILGGDDRNKSSANLVHISAPAQHVCNVIIGAGPTGLSAAYHLGKDTVLLDKNSHVGGWCRSIEDKGFTFDYAGHIMFSNDEYVLQLYKTLLGDNIHWQNREAWVYSKGVHTRYPFQGALYGLPPEVIKECIVGAVEARYGAVKEQPSMKDKSCNMAVNQKEISDCCADGTVDVPASVSGKNLMGDKSANSSSNPITNPTSNLTSTPENFEDFIYKVWGKGIAKHFAIPYNKKIWTVPLTEMETSWLGGRVPLPDIEEIISGALEPSGKPMGPNARFGYPLHGGFQAIMDGFLPHIKGTLELNADVKHISPKQRTVELADGRRYRYENLISTMPLPQLIRMIGDEAPQVVIDAANGLKHISIRCVNLGIARENITDKHWIYYPEDSIFHRIFLQGNASPGCNPPDGFGLTCEISYSPWKPLPYSGQQLIERCFQDCIDVGLLNETDRLITANEVDMPYAYVVYDHARTRNVAIVKQWLAGFGITLAGRYSEWEYYNSDHAFLAGKKAAEAMGCESQQSAPAI